MKADLTPVELKRQEIHIIAEAWLQGMRVVVKAREARRAKRSK